MTVVNERPQRMYRNPFRMFFSSLPWAATGYLASYLVVGPVLFSIALTVVLLAGALSIIWIGLPLLIGAAVIVRGAAAIERYRAGLVIEPIASSYRRVTGRGMFAQLKTRWSDPATLRDLAYLVLMYVPLYVLDTVILAVWLAFVGMITVPFWYWSIPQTWDNGSSAHGVMVGYLPHGPHSTFSGADGMGVWIGDLPTAVGMSAVFFVLCLGLSYVVTGAARLHAVAARGLLGPHVDPLAHAKCMLTESGPLSRTRNDGEPLTN